MIVKFLPVKWAEPVKIGFIFTLNLTRFIGLYSAYFLNCSFFLSFREVHIVSIEWLFHLFKKPFSFYGHPKIDRFSSDISTISQVYQNFSLYYFKCEAYDM